ncbi:MAG: hypothetical protein CMB67_01345 [Euryarchaeota archaeon]|nr:hypothetical protein [Euryarchaeota archaeon]|tara:strand:+ start:271 stop:615 length:345 start_codon:yes stop_codon:yes gene_type:complete
MIKTMAGRRASKRKSARRVGAKEAVSKLSETLVESLQSNTEIANNAASQILSLGKKYGVRPNSAIRRIICRTCMQSLVPGKSSRVRIHSKTIKTTCLRCERVTRKALELDGDVI